MSWGFPPLTFERNDVPKRQGVTPREVSPAAGQSELVSDVAANDSIVFEVEIEPATEPIHGFVRSAGQEVGFDGWVGLAAAIETLVHGPENANAKGRP